MLFESYIGCKLLNPSANRLITIIPRLFPWPQPWHAIFFSALRGVARVSRVTQWARPPVEPRSTGYGALVRDARNLAMTKNRGGLDVAMPRQVSQAWRSHTWPWRMIEMVDPILRNINMKHYWKMASRVSFYHCLKMGKQSNLGLNKLVGCCFYHILKIGTTE